MDPAANRVRSFLFRPDDDSAARIRRWRESNRALARLLASHRKRLGRAVVRAQRIGGGIDLLTPRMAALCLRTCRFCPEPCCITNTVWFDFRDLLVFHLLGAPIPPCQAATEPNEACPYLALRGCRLPPRIRPWMCIQYLCPAQRAVLDNGDRAAGEDLMGRIEAIDQQRIRLEKAVTRGIKAIGRPPPGGASLRPH